jgi:plasmid stability protein
MGMIQLRNVPPGLHRKLKSRAALAGMSLSDYLIDIIRRDAERPTVDELLARLRDRQPIESDLSAADIIREQRGPI